MRRLLLVIPIMISAAIPTSANDRQSCFQGQEPQLTIKGCSEIIRREPNDAIAYHHRAVAYGLAGDIDQAIRDYSKTIEIAPNSPVAYENRGRAYASKGDYAHALADVTKASELSKAAAPQSAPKADPSQAAVAARPNPPKIEAIPREKAWGGAWPPWFSTN